jgi:hypothetical protein
MSNRDITYLFGNLWAGLRKKWEPIFEFWDRARNIRV